MFALDGRTDVVTDPLVHLIYEKHDKTENCNPELSNRRPSTQAVN